jgi:hypothetical protein
MCCTAWVRYCAVRLDQCWTALVKGRRIQDLVGWSTGLPGVTRAGTADRRGRTHSDRSRLNRTSLQPRFRACHPFVAPANRVSCLPSDWRPGATQKAFTAEPPGPIHFENAVLVVQIQILHPPSTPTCVLRRPKTASPHAIRLLRAPLRAHWSVRDPKRRASPAITAAECRSPPPRPTPHPAVSRSWGGCMKFVCLTIIYCPRSAAWDHRAPGPRAPPAVDAAQSRVAPPQLSHLTDTKRHRASGGWTVGGSRDGLARARARAHRPWPAAGTRSPAQIPTPP